MTKTIIPNTTLFTYGKLPECAIGASERQGDVTAMVIREPAIAEMQVLFRDSAGNTSKIRLPGFPSSDAKGVIESIWQGDGFFTLGGYPQFSIREYQLAGSPLPTSATLVMSSVVGGSDCRILGDNALALQSGGLLFSWYSNVSSADYHVDYGFAYRPSGGTWTVIPVRVDSGGLGGGIVMSKMAMAQHPADGSVWAFPHRDSYHSMPAIHFTETADGLRLDWVSPDFLDSHLGRDRENGPDGEFPDLVAIADPLRNKILLAYQDWHWELAPLVRQNYVTIAAIAADGNKEFIQYPTWVVQGRGLAMWLRGGQIDLAYYAMPSASDVYLNSYNGAWGTPTYMTTGRPLLTQSDGMYCFWDELAYAANRHEIVMQHKDPATGALSIEIIDMEVPPLPVPEPIPEPTPIPEPIPDPIPAPTPTPTPIPPPVHGKKRKR